MKVVIIKNFSQMSGHTKKDVHNKIYCNIWIKDVHHTKDIVTLVAFNLSAIRFPFQGADIL